MRPTKHFTLELRWSLKWMSCRETTSFLTRDERETDPIDSSQLLLTLFDFHAFCTRCQIQDIFCFQVISFINCNFHFFMSLFFLSWLAPHSGMWTMIFDRNILGWRVVGDHNVQPLIMDTFSQLDSDPDTDWCQLNLFHQFSEKVTSTEAPSISFLLLFWVI